MRVRTVVKVAAVAAVALVVAAVAILKSIDFSQYRGLIAERVEAATGRRLTIEGDFDLRLLTFAPSVTVGNVAFANAPWGTRPEMARIKRLEAQVALLPLLFGTVEVKRVVLVEPDILLETDADGAGNWIMKGRPAEAPVAAEPAPEAPAVAEAGGAALPVVSEVRIRDATLTYLDGRTGKRTALALDTLSAVAEDAQAPLRVSASGNYNGGPFALDATLGPLGRLGDPDTPWPVSLSAEAGGATLGVTGTIRAPLEGRGLDLALRLEGDDLASLGAFAGAELPEVRPYRVSARLADDGATVTLGDIQATAGRSTLSGDVTLTRAERPQVQANLDSSLLDLTEWAGRGPAPDGAPPAQGKGMAQGEGAAQSEDAEAPAKDAAKDAARDERLFSDAPLDLAALGAVDAEAEFTAARVVTKGPVLENLTVTLTLKDGKLAVSPLAADVAEGRIVAEATLEAPAEKTAEVAARVEITELELAALMDDIGVDRYVSGRGSFTAAVTGRGDSVRAIMAGLAGRTSLAVGEGRIDNGLMQILLADLAKAALGQGQDAKLNCMVSRFEIADGLAVSKALVMDTETVTVTGEGEVNLATEAVDLVLSPEPKEVSLASVAVPVRVKGRLASPAVYPDPAGVAKKAAGFVAGTMTGAGAVGLLAPLVPGAGGEDNPCVKLLSGGGAAPAGAPAGAPATAEEAAPAERKGPAETLIEGVGDGLKSIGRGIKGLFE